MSKIWLIFSRKFGRWFMKKECSFFLSRRALYFGAKIFTKWGHFIKLLKCQKFKYLFSQNLIDDLWWTFVHFVQLDELYSLVQTDLQNGGFWNNLQNIENLNNFCWKFGRWFMMKLCPFFLSRREDHDGANRFTKWGHLKKLIKRRKFQFF